MTDRDTRDLLKELKKLNKNIEDLAKSISGLRYPPIQYPIENTSDTEDKD